MMLLSARTAVVVADHTKFNRFAPVRVENFDRVTHLVTDRRPDAPLVAVLAAMPIEILVQDPSR